VATELPKLTRLADKISDLVDDLEEQLKAFESERALREEQSALEARLAEIRQTLKPGQRATVPAAAPAASAKTVRNWATENGVHCPTHGRVPSRVMDAYEQATGTASAGSNPSGGDSGG
jgi:hypothetical protein